MNRRYYIAPLEVAHAHRDLFHTMAGAHYLCLYDPTQPGARETWEAAGKPVLLNVAFRLEAHADRWHDHPDVAILPDHVEEGTHTLQSHVDGVVNATVNKLKFWKSRPATVTIKNRKLKQHHLKHLSAIGVKDTHTVLHVEAEAVKRNRSMKLRSVL